jgi:glyoxylase-like metal-dependent hydrolase (beta-lactamase superfamily II)
MIFRQFCASDKQLSYLFADPVTRQAVIVDPHLGLEEAYFTVIEHLDLRLIFVLESHCHESHRSAAPVLCEETGAQRLIPLLARDPAAARAVHDHEDIFFGEEHFSALHTPGHSPCSTCFCWNGRVFTGHTLLCGAAGPCNRPDSNAEQLHDSIVGQLYTLPGETVVCPGYEMDGVKSTINDERSCNRELTAATPRESFIALKNRGAGSPAWPILRPVPGQAQGSRQ